MKLALLGDTATQFLATAIRGYAVEYALRVDLFEAEYNQVERQMLDFSSEYHQFHADYTIVFKSAHKLAERHALLNETEKRDLADTELDFLRTVCQQCPGKIIYCNWAEIEDGVFGSYANKVSSSFTYQTRKFNFELMSFAQSLNNLFICDIAGLQNKLGRDRMFDASIYTSTELVFSLDAIPYVAKRIIDIIAALQGSFKKCLILDLDNTLWGGVIGDDGLEGIQLGHGLSIGKAFTEFQMWIKKLKDRGIILAVCSKNNEDTAKEPFEKHPDMILRLEDISVFVANWNTKVENIRLIQKILNIGFDSMVFLDDNPFERNIVRENIPGITVPELPEDPAEYLEYLYGLNLFETGSYSVADSARTQQYQEESKRVSLAQTFDNENDFLESLSMVSEVSSFNKFNTPRVAQLSQRSNQFNLRTVRYTEADIEHMSTDTNVVGMAFTLKDKFGDNGLIAVIILKGESADTLFIDTWFMSCRVLKRGMENFTLNCIVEKAKALGYKRIVGEYIPTAKNKMVSNHYSDLGFKTLQIDGERHLYELMVDDYIEKECYIAIKK